MPKSKRARVVHLSKTEKKGKELTLKLFANVRECLDRYSYCFVFAVENMRNTYLKEVRTQLPDDRLFFGKTKVMAKALGATPEDEYQPNLRNLSKYLSGNVGLFFTSRDPTTVESFFTNFAPSDYARAGSLTSRSFSIPAGIVMSRAGEVPADEDVPLAHSIEPTLRSLGVSSRLVKGKVVLENEHEVCKDGDVLDPKQTRLLKMFGVQTAEFRVRLVAYWSAATNEVKTIDAIEA
ncbi:MAG: mRNA turnover and ribosome assembly protein [Caeruleum heppii]|nr:MAG: mRNA turnover and ribosome assembly protein [Caeruleum heppii]